MKSKFIRLLVVLFAVFFLMTALCVVCGAELAADELYDALPEDAAEMLDKNGITPEGGAGSVPVSDIFGTIAELVGESAGKPLKMFGAVTAVILLASLLSGVSDAAGGTVGKIYPLVTSLTCAAIISVYMSGILDTARAAFAGISDFMLVYIPVMAGVTAAGGHTASAAVFSSVSLTAIQVLARLTSSVIIPLTSCMIGITAAGSADPDLGLDRLGEGIKKFIVWGLGLIMTIFLGILSVQTVITSASDNAAMKTLKFAVSSAVPIVGGAASEALSAVSGSISLLKTGIGGFGIAAGVCMVLPPAVTAVCYKFLLFAAGVLSDLFGCGGAGRMIRSGENVMSVIIASLTCFFLFVTVSSALLLAFCRT